MRVVRRAELTATPWKNGGGVTYQLGCGPAGAGFDDFDWRISMAEIAADGPFSAFPGIDRTLTLLEGAGLVLDFGGNAVTLAPGAPPLSFPGEAGVAARLPGGPVTDLNVMTRRGRVSHHVAPLAAIAGARAPEGTVAIVARGAGRAGPFALSPGDAVLGFGDAEISRLDLQGDLLVIGIREVTPPERA